MLGRHWNSFGIRRDPKGETEMKKIVAVLLSVLTVCCLLPSLMVGIDAKNEAAPERKVSYYTGSKNGDTAWYTGEATEYVLTSADQFYGFMALVNSANLTFDGVTVKLDCDVVFNTGDASTWTPENRPKYEWEPIGNSKAGKKGDGVMFCGNFDGQGHFISGLWTARARDTGLFLNCIGATVKNFAVVNSRFYNTGENAGAAQGASSVVTRCRNTRIENVYSNAFVRGGWCTGGIVGYWQGSTDGYSELRSCVFAGTVDATLASGGGAGGLIGTDESAGAMQSDPEACGVVENCIFSGVYQIDGTVRNKTVAMEGGLIGEIQNVTVRCCINTGRLSATGVDLALWGNIAGQIKKEKSTVNTEFRNNYYDLSGMASIDRTVGTDQRAKNEAGEYTDKGTFLLDTCAGLTSAEFTAEKLVGLDFTSVWTAVEGGYPMPIGAWSIWNSVKAIDFRSLTKPAEEDPPKPPVNTNETPTETKPGPAESKPETKGNDTAGSTPNTTADVPEKKDGCSSSLGAASLAMLLIAGFGTALIGKKR